MMCDRDKRAAHPYSLSLWSWPKSGTYLSLAALFFPCNEAAFEAMFYGFAERGGGGLTLAK